MKICILGSREKKPQDLWLLEEAKKRFEKVTYAQIPDVRIQNGDPVLLKGTPLSSYDIVFPRIPRTYRNYGYVICKLLEGKTYMPITPESIIITHDKFLTLLKLEKAGIPTPLSYLSSTVKGMKPIIKSMKYPVVIKLLQGSLGKGVMFAESPSSALPILDTIEGMKQPIMLEEFVGNPGEDIRALVIGHDVPASMKRIAEKGERRANIGAGGTGKKIRLSQEMTKLAIRSAKALGLGIAGIDIIEGKKGPVVIEANVNVHFEGITHATGTNVAALMMDYVKHEAEISKKDRLIAPIFKAVEEMTWGR
ncbi:MAG: RimK family alpha-L-glutamate ligase [Candidatus Aenigmarchaeota archaeon]|nr:RimK family alpha-L-glutamate ligase [Candidatus Aenigmarchaeota archaeon]